MFARPLTQTTILHLRLPTTRIHRLRPLPSQLPQLLHLRTYTAMPSAIPLKTKHLLSIADLSVPELNSLLSRSAELKHSVKNRGTLPGITEFTPGPLTGETVALMFSKRSTRTRVSTESAVALLGGHPMFLGKDDIQLGVPSLVPCPYSLYIPAPLTRQFIRYVLGLLRFIANNRSMNRYMIPHESFPQWSP